MGETSLINQIDLVKKTLNKNLENPKFKEIGLFSDLLGYVENLKENYTKKFSDNESNAEEISKKLIESIGDEKNGLIKNVIEANQRISGESGDEDSEHESLLPQTRKPEWLLRSKTRIMQIKEHLSNNHKQSSDPYQKEQRRKSLQALESMLSRHNKLIKIVTGALENESHDSARLSKAMSKPDLKKEIDSIASSSEDLQNTIQDRRLKHRCKLILTEMERMMRTLAEKQHLDHIDYRDIEYLESLKTKENDVVPYNEELNKYIEKKCKILRDLKQNLTQHQRQKHNYQQQLILMLQQARIQKINENQLSYTANDQLLKIQKSLLCDTTLERIGCEIRSTLGRYLWPLCRIPLIKHFANIFITEEEDVISELLNKKMLDMPNHTGIAKQFRNTLAAVLQYKRENKIRDPAVDRLLEKLFDHQTVSENDAKFENDSIEPKLAALIECHRQQCERIYNARYQQVQKTLHAIVFSPLQKARDETVDEFLTDLGFEKDTDPTTYALGMKLYYLFKQYPDQDQENPMINLSLLEKLYNKHFNSDQSQFVNEKPISGKQRLESFSADLHVLFGAIQNYQFPEESGLADDNKVNAILKPLKRDLNRFTEQFSCDFRLTEKRKGQGEFITRGKYSTDKNGYLVYDENNNLIRDENFKLTNAKKIQDRETKKSYFSKANFISFILALGQAFLSFYALSALSIWFGPFAMPIALFCSAATLFTNYNLFRAETYDLLKQLFLRKDYFNSFTSKKGKVGMAVALFAALFMAITMTVLVGASVLHTFAGPIAFPLATVLCATSLIGFTALMYVSIASVIKAAVGFYERFRAIKREEHNLFKALKRTFHDETDNRFNSAVRFSKNGIKKNLSAKDWELVDEWAKQNRDRDSALNKMIYMKRARFVVDLFVYPLFLVSAWGIFIFATVATLGAWQAEMQNFLFSDIGLATSLSAAISFGIVCSFTAIVEMTFNLRAFTKAFFRFAGYGSTLVNKAIIKPLFAVGSFLTNSNYRDAQWTKIQGVSRVYTQTKQRLERALYAFIFNSDDSAYSSLNEKSEKQLKFDETIYKGWKKFKRFIKGWFLEPVAVGANAFPNGALLIAGTLQGYAQPTISLGSSKLILFANAVAGTIQSVCCNANALKAFEDVLFPLNEGDHCDVEIDENGKGVKKESATAKVMRGLDWDNEQKGSKHGVSDKKGKGKAKYEEGDDHYQKVHDSPTSGSKATHQNVRGHLAERSFAFEINTVVDVISAPTA